MLPKHGDSATPRYFLFKELRRRRRILRELPQRAPVLVEAAAQPNGCRPMRRPGGSGRCTGASPPRARGAVRAKAQARRAHERVSSLTGCRRMGWAKKSDGSGLLVTPLGASQAAHRSRRAQRGSARGYGLSLPPLSQGPDRRTRARTSRIGNRMKSERSCAAFQQPTQLSCAAAHDGARRR